MSDKVWCARCKGKGHMCEADINLEGDYPLCNPCSRNQPCAKSTATVTTPTHRVPLTTEAVTPRDVPKEVTDLAHKANLCLCRPGCREEARPGKPYAWGHKKLAKKRKSLERIEEANQRTASHPLVPTRAPVIATAVHNAKHGASSVPFKIEIFTAQEYADKFEKAAFINPEVAALIDCVEARLTDGMIMTVTPRENDSVRNLQDRIRRNFDKSFSDKPFTIVVAKEEAFNHVRIQRIDKPLKEENSTHVESNRSRTAGAESSRLV